MEGQVNVNSQNDFEIKISHQDFQIDRLKLFLGADVSLSTTFTSQSIGSEEKKIFLKRQTFGHKMSFPFVYSILDIPLPGVLSLGPLFIGPISGEIGSNSNFSASSEVFSDISTGIQYHRNTGNDKFGSGLKVIRQNGKLNGGSETPTKLNIETGMPFAVSWINLDLEKANYIRDVYKNVRAKVHKNFKYTTLLSKIKGKIYTVF